MKLVTKTRNYRLILVLTALIFWTNGLVFSWRHGNQAYGPTDGTSEQIVGYSALQYAKEGFFKNYLLPTYPPFGEDEYGQSRTKPFVYNHYIAGSDLVLGAWFKVFGEGSLWGARMVPHTLSTLALLAFGFAVGVLMSSPGMGLVAASALLIPRSFSVWSTCLYGHSYASAWMILVFSACIYLAAQKRSSKKRWMAYFACGAGAGFFIPFFALDWVLVTPMACVAALLFVLPTNDSLIATHKRTTAPLLLGYGLGVGLACVYQLTISSLYFGSVTAAVNDGLLWLRLKSAGDFNNKNLIDHPMGFVIRTFNKYTYGATGMTAYNWLAVTAAFLWLGTAAKAVPGYVAVRGVFALILAYLGCISWSVVMKSHAMSNIHFTQRHYLALFMVCLLILLTTGRAIVKRSKNAGAVVTKNSEKTEDWL